MQYFKKRSEKLASHASKSTYTFTTVHLNGLPITLQHTAAAITLQDCTTSHDIGYMGFLNGMVTGPFHSTVHTVLNLVKRKNLIATWHWWQLDHNCDHQISTSIRVKCWWHRRFSRQRNIMEADHCGRWTQIFGGKVSEPQTSGPVV